MQADSPGQAITNNNGQKEKGIYDGNIAVVAGSGNAIYAGGSLKIAGGARANSIAKQDGQNWHSSPSDFVLHQNYPNPFNPATTISFQMPQAGIVSLKIFDQLGREVKTLLHEQRAAGQHRISFEAHGLPSGFYVYQLQANGLILSRRMLLVRQS